MKNIIKRFMSRKETIPYVPDEKPFEKLDEALRLLRIRMEQNQIPYPNGIIYPKGYTK